MRVAWVGAQQRLFACAPENGGCGYVYLFSCSCVFNPCAHFAVRVRVCDGESAILAVGFGSSTCVVCTVPASACSSLTHCAGNRGGNCQATRVRPSVHPTSLLRYMLPCTLACEDVARVAALHRLYCSGTVLRHFPSWCTLRALVAARPLHHWIPLFMGRRLDRCTTKPAPSACII